MADAEMQEWVDGTWIITDLSYVPVSMNDKGVGYGRFLYADGTWNVENKENENEGIFVNKQEALDALALAGLTEEDVSVVPKEETFGDALPFFKDLFTSIGV